jgi:hypothetical protein
MSSFRIRPRFKHFIKGDKAELEHTIHTALVHEKRFSFHHIPEHICIKIHPSERHVWSPQLDISFEQDGESVIVRGLYGPNPSLWVLFFFGYVIIGILILFLGMWGLSVWMIGGSLAILWGIPVLGVAALVLYLFSQTGQKLGAQQLFDIHHFYEGITKDRVLVT